MTDAASNDLAAKLERLVGVIDVSKVLSEPLTKAIEGLLRVSAARLRSEDASVLVRTGENGDLKFIAATGSVADQVIGMSIPSGKGIAGFVAMSGQPIAVSDTADETSFYAEVDKTTGYSTKMILAVPLRFRDEVIGVLEYVNRVGDPPFEPFTSDEMDNAAIYADAIAALVDAHTSTGLLARLSERVLEGSNEDDLVDIRKWLSGLRASPDQVSKLELAVIVNQLASRGEREVALSREILSNVIKYLDTAGGDYLRYEE